MQRTPCELSPLELVEAFVTIFCFLKDSSADTDTLLEDFRTCQGYAFLTEFLLRLEQEQSEGDDAAKKSSSERMEATRDGVPEGTGYIYSSMEYLCSVGGLCVQIHSQRTTPVRETFICRVFVHQFMSN